MTNIDKLQMVKSSLFQFVNKHIKAADLSVVDDIVLNYVIAILEEATEDPNFDVDGKKQKDLTILCEEFFDDFSQSINGVFFIHWFFCVDF